MHRIVSWLMTGGLAWQVCSSAVLAGESGAAPAGPGACALLTRELVIQVSPQSRESLNLILSLPKEEEERLGAGTACEYGNIRLQIDPFVFNAALEKQLAKDHTRVPGIGDVAYFRDNRGNYAELYVLSGKRVVTVQMSVPDGRTAASIQPNTIELVKAVLPKLK